MVSRCWKCNKLIDSGVLCPDCKKQLEFEKIERERRRQEEKDERKRNQ